MIEYVTIPRLAELTGYTEDAIRSKIDRGQWREGSMFIKAPDGRLHIHLENYQRWVRGEALVELKFEKAQTAPDRSASRSRISAGDTDLLSVA